MDREPARKDMDNAVLFVKEITTNSCLSLKWLQYVLSREARYFVNITTLYQWHCKVVLGTMILHVKIEKRTKKIQEL